MPRSKRSPIEIRIEADMLEIIPAYLDTLHRNAAEMRRALEHGDMGVIQNRGHQMKGEGAAFGFHEVSAIGKRLENAAETGATASIRLELDALDDYLSRLSVSAL